MRSSTFLVVATSAGATGGPAFAEAATVAPAVAFCFFVGANLTVMDPEELLMFCIELSSSDGGTLNPVGFAIPSIVRNPWISLTADNL